MTAILRYDAKAGRSLPEVLNGERTPTVNMGGKKLEAAYGASRSQRFPMAVVDRKGGRREGFFTKKETVAPKAQWDALVEEIAGRYPTQEQREKQAQSEENMKKLGFDLKDLEDGADVVAEREFAERLKPVYLSAQQAFASGHRVGDRVDHRSAAMNAVGDLLGTPELLARSQPMKLKDADGNVIEGSFTEKSKGYDLDNSIQSFAGVSDDPFAGTDGKFLKELADLQVLDYLCGNVGRHFGSMTYETDDKGRGKLPPVGDLGVVSASMAKKIKRWAASWKTPNGACPPPSTGR